MQMILSTLIQSLAILKKKAKELLIWSNSQKYFLGPFLTVLMNHSNSRECMESKENPIHGHFRNQLQKFHNLKYQFDKSRPHFHRVSREF